MSEVLGASQGRLVELVARLERAEAPGRSFDRDIFRLIGLTEVQERHCEMWCKMDGRTDLTRERYVETWAPDFTKSIDAALTLVPEGYAWCVFSNRHFVLSKTDDYFGATVETMSVKNTVDRKPTPAIALCIAALKARATKDPI